MSSSTDNLGLTLPADGERLSLGVLNQNWQKLDTFAGKVGYYPNVGTISTLSALQDTISSIVGTDYTPRRIMFMFALGAAFGVFTATGQNHLCQVDVTQQSRWNVLIEQHSNIGNIYRGTNAGGTWSWDKLALGSQIDTINGLLTPVAVPIVPDDNIDLFSNTSTALEVNGCFYVAVTGMAKVNITNANLFTLSSSKAVRKSVVIPMGIGTSQWTNNESGYCYASLRTFIGTVPQGKWFHVIAMIPCA